MAEDDAIVRTTLDRKFGPEDTALSSVAGQPVTNLTGDFTNPPLPAGAPTPPPTESKTYGPYPVPGMKGVFASIPPAYDEAAKNLGLFEQIAPESQKGVHNALFYPPMVRFMDEHPNADSLLARAAVAVVTSKARSNPDQFNQGFNLTGPITDQDYQRFIMEVLDTAHYIQLGELLDKAKAVPEHGGQAGIARPGTERPGQQPNPATGVALGQEPATAKRSTKSEKI